MIVTANCHYYFAAATIAIATSAIHLLCRCFTEEAGLGQAGVWGRGEVLPGRGPEDPRRCAPFRGGRVTSLLGVDPTPPGHDGARGKARDITSAGTDFRNTCEAMWHR